MTIELNQEQYKNLLIMSAVANSIFGVLGDMMPDDDYKKRSEEMEELENYFLQQADDFDCGEFTEVNGAREDEVYFSDEKYEEEILPIIDDYDEYVLISELANRLAWRDFHRAHTKKEIDKIFKKNSSGYFGVEIHPYEQRYWDEFDKNGIERLEIKE